MIAGALLAAPVAAQEGDDTVVIAALGDSLTAGYGLPAEANFPARLQAWLDGRGADARVVNAGVSGDTTAGGLARLDWTLTEEVDALIVALGGNDFLRGTEPAVSRGNLAGIIERAQARGIEVLLVGIDASAQYGPEFERDFDAMYPALAEEFGVLVEPDWFGALRDEGRPLSEVPAGTMQPDGIHPSAAGVELIVEELGPRVLELIGEVRADEAAG